MRPADPPLPTRQATELVFVEGGSTDGTREEIEQQSSAHPDAGHDDRAADRAAARATPCDGLRGRGERRSDDPRRRSERPAGGPAEVLSPRVRRGRGDFVNGSRLVYDIEPGAMRFANMVGNKFFSLLFQAIMGQQVKDTLCGTKVLRQVRLRADRSWPRVLRRLRPVRRLRPAARRGATEHEDRRPAGAIPAAHVRQTNISRWRHGLLLLRMTLFAFWKFRVEVIRGRR